MILNYRSRGAGILGHSLVFLPSGSLFCFTLRTNNFQIFRDVSASLLPSLASLHFFSPFSFNFSIHYNDFRSSSLVLDAFSEFLCKGQYPDLSLLLLSFHNI